ncbi:DUF4282 domain-containing protein [Alkalibacterium putridalgicola]|uniref:DUF4282 domain-containing protein n=1 Tax=Alkalibacterium putridalgicola TaxID=426703 RepID=UPI0034CDAC3D
MNYNVENQKDSFFNFDTMITPKIIQIIFYIGLAISVVSGLTTMFSGDSVFLGLAILVIGPLVIRVNCELVIVIFKIHEALQDMRYR